MPLNLKDCTVWVLAPYLISGKDAIDYYYDYSQSIAEYKRVFEGLGISWKWQEVTIENYPSIIDEIALLNQQQNQLVFNLCDGDEVNQTPGISVIHYLEKKGICYTGADAYFFEITTSKITMKNAFNLNGVPTAPWQSILKDPENIDALFRSLGSPLILKPSVSGGSMGITVKNVVEDSTSFQTQLNSMFKGYRGWELAEDGVIVESFINGPEYTVFIRGNHYDKNKATIYTPVERVFHASLPEKEKFLSYDRLWEIYEDETPMPNNEFFYEYQMPDKNLHAELQSISWDAFVACRGTGYARVDIRMDLATKQFFVLEVNAQCGISEDENYTSIGAILKISNTSFSELIVSILSDAMNGKQNQIAV
jgi:D-alanine-D-alanine ligase